MCLKVSVYLLSLCWGPGASPHSQAIFHPTAAVHTEEGAKWGVEWGEVGSGLARVAAGKTAELQRLGFG